MESQAEEEVYATPIAWEYGRLFTLAGVMIHSGKANKLLEVGGRILEIGARNQQVEIVWEGGAIE